MSRLGPVKKTALIGLLVSMLASCEWPLGPVTAGTATPTQTPCPRTVTILSPQGSSSREEERAFPHQVSSPVQVTWGEICRREMVIQVYHQRKSGPVFPAGDPHAANPWGTLIDLAPSGEPYEIKVWISGTGVNDHVWVTVVSP